MAIRYPLRILKKAVDIRSGKKVLRQVEVLQKLPVEAGNISALCRYLYSHYGHGTFVIKDAADRPVMHAMVFANSHKLLQGELKDELRALETGEGMARGNERVAAVQRTGGHEAELEEVRAPMFENRLLEEVHAAVTDMQKSLKEQEMLIHRLHMLETTLSSMEEKVNENVQRTRSIEERISGELAALRHSFTDRLVEVRGALDAFPAENLRAAAARLESESGLSKKLQGISDSDDMHRMERRLGSQLDRIIARLEKKEQKERPETEGQKPKKETEVKPADEKNGRRKRVIFVPNGGHEYQLR